MSDQELAADVHAKAAALEVSIQAAAKAGIHCIVRLGLNGRLAQANSVYVFGDHCEPMVRISMSRPGPPL